MHASWRGGGPGGRPETRSRLLTLIYVHCRQCEPPKMQKKHLLLSTQDFSSILFTHSSKQKFPAHSRLAWNNQRYWKRSYARGSKDYAATFGQRVSKQALLNTGCLSPAARQSTSTLNPTSDTQLHSTRLLVVTPPACDQRLSFTEESTSECEADRFCRWEYYLY